MREEGKVVSIESIQSCAHMFTPPFSIDAADSVPYRIDGSYATDAMTQPGRVFDCMPPWPAKRDSMDSMDSIFWDFSLGPRGKRRVQPLLPPVFTSPLSDPQEIASITSTVSSPIPDYHLVESSLRSIPLQRN